MDAGQLQANRWSLAFLDRDLEATFAEEQARKSIRPLRLAVLWITAAVLLLTPGVIYVAPQAHLDLPRIFTIAAVLLAMMATTYVVTYTQAYIRWHQVLMLVIGVLIALGDIRLASSNSTQGLVASGFYLVALQVFAIYGVLRLRFPAATAAGWISMVLYLVLLSLGGYLPDTSLLRHGLALLAANLIGMLVCYQMDLAVRQAFVALREAAYERARSDRLLLNILPVSIADRLKSSPEAIADHSAQVTVLFADIVGFTAMSTQKSPHELVRLLDRIFTDFDTLAERHGLEKIKTIGDAYMAAAGLPFAREDHAAAAANMAHDMLESIAKVAAETGEPLALRIGLNSGPVVAGVIGRKKFIYDLWGDTVNTASRMESNGLPGAIQCSEATAAHLRATFGLEARQPLDVQGKGVMQTYLLSAFRPSALPAARR
ncbi:MAG TPA: adenylate/guanylate cyclase domain-containing protein [Ramlibacter sp.]|nr:adenylate/guanylate cyclase domain-containing protein [Ramlibacter sp.]